LIATVPILIVFVVLTDGIQLQDEH